MAYVLGFFAADGCLTKNPKRQNYYIEFVSTDLDVLEKIKQALKSQHKISSRKRDSRWKQCYRLQIGSKKVFTDLLKLGFTQNKSNTMSLPEIAIEYFGDFLRGYFDGDGCISFGIYKRKNRPSGQKLITIRFTSGSERFLIQLKNKIAEVCRISGGFTYKKQRGGYELVYSNLDTLKILRYIYQCKNCIYMNRKYNKSMEILAPEGW